MANGMYYNPVLLARLEAFFGAEDWDGMDGYLGSLSHRDFRAACGIIGTRILPSVAADVFWHAFLFLLVRHSKAFLMTLLKAVPPRKREGGFTLRAEGYLPVARFLNEEGTGVDRDKFVRFMVGVSGEELDELSYLFDSLHVDTPRERLHYLLQGNGMACYYLLFQCMRQLEHERGLLVRCCLYLMKKGDALSFNLASLARSYFDLSEVKGTFSLRLAPYQLGSLESSFEGFGRVLRSMA